MYVRMYAYEQYYIGMRMRALKGYDNSSSLNITLVLVFALGGILPGGTCFDSSNPIFNRYKGLILFSLLFFLSACLSNSFHSNPLLPQCLVLLDVGRGNPYLQQDCTRL